MFRVPFAGCFLVPIPTATTCDCIGISCLGILLWIRRFRDRIEADEGANEKQESFEYHICCCFVETKVVGHQVALQYYFSSRMGLIPEFTSGSVGLAHGSALCPPIQSALPIQTTQIKP